MEDSPMNLSTPNILPTPAHLVELERLGDAIAELSAHLDAATARLLDLIREFDARGGWGNGFASCTAEHVERIVRGWRRVDRIAEAQESTRRHQRRALHVYQDEDGMVVVRGRLEPEAGAVLMKAVEAGREALYRRRDDVSAETRPD